MLLVITDHGFLLGEHDWWGKARMPWYNETAHIPFFAWEPRCPIAGERRQSLTTTMDISPTLLDHFGLAPPPDMDGQPLRATIEEDAKVRDVAIFGMFGAHVNITDGRYRHMCAPVAKNAPLNHHTLVPTHMRSPFTHRELANMQWHPPLPFTKGCPVMRIPSVGLGRFVDAFQTQLLDLTTDPGAGPAAGRRSVGAQIRGPANRSAAGASRTTGAVHAAWAGGAVAAAGRGPCAKGFRPLSSGCPTADRAGVPSFRDTVRRWPKRSA